MSEIITSCPQCGGKIESKDFREYIICDYCGNKVILRYIDQRSGQSENNNLNNIENHEAINDEAIMLQTTPNCEKALFFNIETWYWSFLTESGMHAFGEKMPKGSIGPGCYTGKRINTAPFSTIGVANWSDLILAHGSFNNDSQSIEVCFLFDEEIDPDCKLFSSYFEFSARFNVTTMKYIDEALRWIFAKNKARYYLSDDLDKIHKRYEEVTGKKLDYTNWGMPRTRENWEAILSIL